MSTLASFLEFLSFPFRLLLGPISRHLERRFALRAQVEFEREVRHDGETLFSKHEAEVVPNQGVSFPPSFDGAFVTLRSKNLLIRFERGRGDFNVRVAPTDQPTRWVDLELLIGAIDDPDVPRRRELGSVYQATTALDENWGLLAGALRSRETTDAMQDLTAREEIHRRAAEKEINRRLYDE